MTSRRPKMTKELLVDTVLAARDRIAAGWTRGARARKPPDENAPARRVARHGASTNPRDDEAVAWCMTGALIAEAPQGWRSRGRDLIYLTQEAFDASGILGEVLPTLPMGIERFNDSGNQEKAVGAFDELARWLKGSPWVPDPETLSLIGVDFDEGQEGVRADG